MPKVSLPGGAWASLRDPDAVTNRQRDPFMVAMGKASKFEGMEDGGFGAMFQMQDALVLALVDSWSFDLPVTADSLLDLPAKTVDVLRKECMPYQKDLMPDFGPTPETDTPTEPSGA